MRFMPILSAFAIALIGGVAVGLRPGYSFGTLFIGATLVAAMTGLAASVLQFLPQRYFMPVATIAGVILGWMVSPMLNWAQVIGFGDVTGPTALIWPVAIVAGLLWSRSAGLDFPTMRRSRTEVHQPRAR